MGYETVIYETSPDFVATVTLNRPEALNAFNAVMMAELQSIWREIRDDYNVHAVVLRGAGEKGFTSGLDMRSTTVPPFATQWDFHDVSKYLGPKHNQLWKPVVTAVHGTCCAGAMYFLNESDIVIASDDALFFDSHITYGMGSIFEPIGMAQWVPPREALRWMLLDLEERMSPQRALEIGLISEITTRDVLFDRAHQLAAIIASKPLEGVLASVRAFWETMLPKLTDVDRWGMQYLAALGRDRADNPSFQRPKWSLR